MQITQNVQFYGIGSLLSGNIKPRSNGAVYCSKRLNQDSFVKSGVKFSSKSRSDEEIDRLGKIDAFMSDLENQRIQKIIRDVSNGRLHGDWKDDIGDTVLYWAASRPHISLITALINHGADVNKQNNMGETALFLAAEKNHLGVIWTLIKNGADVNINDNFGNTALSIAKEKGHHNVISLLENADPLTRKLKEKEAFEKSNPIYSYEIPKEEQHAFWEAFREMEQGKK